MSEPRLHRIERELFFAAFAFPTDGSHGWILDRITLMAQETRVRTGQYLWREGDRIDAVYFTHQGRVRCTRAGAPPWTYDGRWLLGILDALRGEPVTRDAVALEDFHALRIPAREWMRLVRSSFLLTQGSIVAGSGAVAQLDERLGARWTPAKREPAPLAPSSALDPTARLRVLHDLDVTRGAGVQALADLAASTSDVTLAAGDRLIARDAKVERLYVVVDGEIEARHTDRDMTRRYVAGDVVGGAAAFSERIRRWDAHAATRSHVLAIPVEAWLDVLEDHFDLVRAHLAAFARWRERLLERIGESEPDGIVLR